MSFPNDFELEAVRLGLRRALVRPLVAAGGERATHSRESEPALVRMEVGAWEVLAADERDGRRLAQLLSNPQAPQRSSALEQLMGIPACCLRASHNRFPWLGRQQADAQPIKYATKAYAPEPRPGLNIFLPSDAGAHQRLISHAPCRLDCGASVESARTLRTALRERYGDSERQLMRSLNGPVALGPAGERARLELAGNVVVSISAESGAAQGWTQKLLGLHLPLGGIRSPELIVLRFDLPRAQSAGLYLYASGAGSRHAPRLSAQGRGAGCLVLKSRSQPRVFPASAQGTDGVLSPEAMSDGSRKLLQDPSELPSPIQDVFKATHPGDDPLTQQTSALLEQLRSPARHALLSVQELKTGKYAQLPARGAQLEASASRHPLARVGKVISLALSGNLPAAQSAFEGIDAVARGPALQGLVEACGLVLRMGEHAPQDGGPTAGRQASTSGRRSPPSSPELAHAQAQSALEAGDFRAAWEMAERAPLEAWSRQLRSKLYVWNGQPKEALDLLGAEGNAPEFRAYVAYARLIQLLLEERWRHCQELAQELLRAGGGSHPYSREELLFISEYCRVELSYDPFRFQWLSRLRPTLARVYGDHPAATALDARNYGSLAQLVLNGLNSIPTGTGQRLRAYLNSECCARAALMYRNARKLRPLARDGGNRPSVAAISKALLREFGGNFSPTSTLIAPHPSQMQWASHAGVEEPRKTAIRIQHRVAWEEPELVSEWLQRFHRQAPEVPYGLTYLGELLLWQGRFQEAHKVFEQVTQEYDTRWGHVGLGAARYHMGDLKGAMRAWKPRSERIPTETTWLYEGELARREGRFRVAAECLEVSVERTPKRLSGWVNLVHVYQELGDLANAKVAYQRSLELVPSIWERPVAELLPNATEVDAALARLSGNRSSSLITWFCEEAPRFRRLPVSVVGVIRRQLNGGQLLGSLARGLAAEAFLFGQFTEK